VRTRGQAQRVVVEERVDGMLRMRHRGPLVDLAADSPPAASDPETKADSTPPALGHARGDPSRESARHLRPGTPSRGDSMKRTFLKWVDNGSALH
jgi:hypothetical protein